LANHKSALKRARQSETRRLRNKACKTRMRNIIKDVRTAAETGSQEKASQKFVEAVSLIQRSASKGVIHRNQANRKVARLARRVNRMTAS
jgi:small subunit ribosomal protein S20